MSDIEVVGALGFYRDRIKERSRDPFRNRTSIICTVRKNTIQRVGSIAKLVEAGMNIARFNMAKIKQADEGTWSWVEKQIQELRAYEGQKGVLVGVMMDLGGPKLRIGYVDSEQYPDPDLEGGTQIIIESNHEVFLKLQKNEEEISGSPECLWITGYIKSLPRLKTDGSQVVLVSDRGYVFRVVKQPDEYTLLCKTDHEVRVHAEDAINFTGIDLATMKDQIGLEDFPLKDAHDLKKAWDLETDIISVSFASPGLIDRVYHTLEQYARETASGEARSKKSSQVRNICLVAKIETPSAVEKIDRILEMRQTSGVMIARGDLALAVSSFSIPYAQTTILQRAIEYGKPAIVATGLLPGIVDLKEPTIARGEAMDIFSAVVSGADALLLSEETTQAENPKESIQILRNMIVKAEAVLYSTKHGDVVKSTAHSSGLPAGMLRPEREETTQSIEIDSATCRPAIEIAERCKAALIAVTATTGRTARILARYKPRQFIIGLTTRWEVARQLLLSRGVFPVVVSFGNLKRETPLDLHSPEDFVHAVKIAVDHLRASRAEMISQIEKAISGDEDYRVSDEILATHLGTIGLDLSAKKMGRGVAIGIMRANFTKSGIEKGLFPNTIHILNLAD